MRFALTSALIPEDPLHCGGAKGGRLCHRSRVRGLYVTVFQVDGAAGEGDFEAHFLEQVHDLETDVLAGFEIFTPGRGAGETVNQDIEAGGAEVGEVDQEEFLVDRRVCAQ